MQAPEGKGLTHSGMAGCDGTLAHASAAIPSGPAVIFSYSPARGFSPPRRQRAKTALNLHGPRGFRTYLLFHHLRVLSLVNRARRKGLSASCAAALPRAGSLPAAKVCATPSRHGAGAPATKAQSVLGRGHRRSCPSQAPGPLGVTAVHSTKGGLYAHRTACAYRARASAPPRPGAPENHGTRSASAARVRAPRALTRSKRRRPRRAAAGGAAPAARRVPPADRPHDAATEGAGLVSHALLAGPSMRSAFITCRDQSTESRLVTSTQ